MAKAMKSNDDQSVDSYDDEDYGGDERGRGIGKERTKDMRGSNNDHNYHDRSSRYSVSHHSRQEGTYKSGNRQSVNEGYYKDAQGREKGSYKQ